MNVTRRETEVRDATGVLDFHDSTAAAVAVSPGASRPGIGRRAVRPPRTKERRIHCARDGTGRGAPPRAARLGRYRADQREMPRHATRKLDSGPNSGLTLRAAAFANGTGVHERNSPDAGTRHRRDHFDFYSGSRCSVEVVTSGEARGTVPFGERIPVLLRGRV